MERGIKLTGNFQPSSFGITFTCLKETAEICIRISVGVYERIEESQNENKWIRKFFPFEEKINLNNPKSEKKYPIGLRYQILSRNPDLYGRRSITFSVINTNTSSNDMVEKSRNSFFQVAFEAEGINGEPPFIDRKSDPKKISDSELKSFYMLYEDVNSFAIGHGCATEWNEITSGKANIVKSAFIPVHEIFPMLPPNISKLDIFNLKQISELNQDEVKEFFEILPETYDKWISDREAEIDFIHESLHDSADKHIKLCRESSARIKSGINLIATNKRVFKAFILAHRAMRYQFFISERIKKGSGKKIPLPDNDSKWFPFQIAFILQSIESILFENSEYRNVADLLWFPTGGGKTEAYLGISAILLFYRRLKEIKGKGGGGVSVITRYTLRLLTIDQFYRSASLICSCEKVRRDDDDLKKSSEISIGLWVGAGASPNSVEDAKYALQKIATGQDLFDESDPLKILNCPWCGEEIGVADYFIKENPVRMEITCPNKDCDFHKKLPVWVTDEDVYRERPSLVIATVDKFARLPWIEEASNLFSTDKKYSPPELIIQDELHLISGPLGTLVGLYETAIEILCKNESGYFPKIIASTATIRNAHSQIKSLFGKDFRQFPQPCLDYSDSFFAKEDKSAISRMYIGIYASGFSNTTTVLRTYGSLLYAPMTFNSDIELKDPYWTLIGYFNSLRELGSTSVLVNDDIQDYLKILWQRDNEMFNPRNLQQEVCELTSRVSNQDLIRYRENLWKSFPDANTPDVVLATNMISVGLDVPRLGLMVITGQPKTTAEYIQASSRIGRKFPGLVITIYNIAHARDRSHYENFVNYHNRIYGEVEATSVTPYSIRSMERGLHAVYISLIRHLLSDMHGNDCALKYSSELPAVNEIRNSILERIKFIDITEFETASKLLDEISSKWESLTTSYDELFYYKHDGNSLLSPFERKQEEFFPTMNSLRNIDQSTMLKKPY